MTLKEESRLNAKGYSTGDERRLLDALGRGLLKDFPNPERIGCPGSEVLKRIASRKMPLDEAAKWLDHLGSCTPCFRDFSELRKVHELRQKRTLLAIAASILVVAGIAGWVLLQRHNETLVAQTAVLDLRNRSASRGTEPLPATPPLEVKHTVSYLELYLPLGSSEGPYDVRIVTLSGQSLVSGSGTAWLTDQVTSLQVRVDLTSVHKGEYILQVRKGDSDWNAYPLIIR